MAARRFVYSDLVRPLFFLLFLNAPLGSLSAQEYHQLKGQIIADSLTGYQINIVNLTAKTGTTSRPNGHFKIPVQKGDTLLFSAVQYHPYYLAVTDSILQRPDIEVHLKRADNLLEPVKISANSLTGDLVKDAKNIPYFDQSKVGFQLQGKPLSYAERQVRYLETNGGLGALISALSGRNAMIRRQLTYFRLEKKRERAIQLVTKKFFIKRLHIPAYHINNFVYYCLEDEDFPEPNGPVNKMKLMQFFEEKAEVYRSFWEDSTPSSNPKEP